MSPLARTHRQADNPTTQSQAADSAPGVATWGVTARTSTERPLSAAGIPTRQAQGCVWDGCITGCKLYTDLDSEILVGINVASSTYPMPKTQAIREKSRLIWLSISAKRSHSFRPHPTCVVCHHTSWTPRRCTLTGEDLIVVYIVKNQSHSGDQTATTFNM